jgi:hypothetical protein
MGFLLKTSLPCECIYELLSVKVTFTLEAAMNEGEQGYSSTFSLTSALDVSGWVTPGLGRFTPGK